MRKLKRRYKLVYEVWSIKRGDFETLEDYCTSFDTEKEARTYIAQERNRLWNLGGARLALATHYEIRKEQIKK